MDGGKVNNDSFASQLLKKMKIRSLVLFVLLSLGGKAIGQNSYNVKSKDGVAIHVTEYGSGKPVVLLSGGPGFNPGYLEPLWKNLPGYRCIVPDQRGTGQSVGLNIDTVSMTVANYVEDLEAIREHLNLTKLTLVGHSWGGMLGMAYAAKYPTHLERLVLLGSGGATEKFFAYFGSNIGMRLYPEDKRDQEAAKGSYVLSLRAIWPGYFYSRERALVTRFAIDSALVNNNSRLIYKYVIGNYKKTSAERVRALQNYRNPVYVIQGRQDPVGESTVYETKSYLPQTRIDFIEECGHLPWLESDKAAGEFYRLLNSALK